MQQESLFATRLICPSGSSIGVEDRKDQDQSDQNTSATHLWPFVGAGEPSILRDAP